MQSLKNVCVRVCATLQNPFTNFSVTLKSMSTLAKALLLGANTAITAIIGFVFFNMAFNGGKLHQITLYEPSTVIVFFELAILAVLTLLNFIVTAKSLMDAVNQA